MDPLKKLVYRIQLNLDAINPDVLFLNPDLNSYNINTNKTKLTNTKVKETYASSLLLLDDTDTSFNAESSLYFGQIAATDENALNSTSVENMNHFVDPSLITNFSATTITGPVFLKWLPRVEMTGEADIKYLFNNQETTLRYHVADLTTLKTSYANNKYVQGFLKLIKFCFKYNTEGKRIDPHKIERSIYFVQVQF